MDKRAIGVFDSGLGGLTVVSYLKKILPSENIVYLGDTARVPYGSRSNETINKFALQDAFFLEKQNVKCIVIACNTASSISYEYLNRMIKTPIFDVVNPGAEEAFKKTKNNSVGVIGTKATIASNSFLKKINKKNSKIKVFQKACPLFVPVIEEGEITGRIINDLADEYLLDFNKNNFDTLILGCTHYPLIEKIIKAKVGNKVKMINPGLVATHNLKSYLINNEMLNDEKNKRKTKYYVTDLNQGFKEVFKNFLKETDAEEIIKVNLDEL